MIANMYVQFKRFLDQSSVGGWVAIVTAVVLMVLIGRGFINTPEHTVTPLSEYSLERGTLKTSSCGQTPTGRAVLNFQIYEQDPTLYEIRVGRNECGDLLRFLQPQSRIEFWVHPSIPDWVGQIAVDQKILVPHSKAYEEAWRSRWVSLWVGLAISSLLLHYAFRGQFKKSRSSSHI